MNILTLSQWIVSVQNQRGMKNKDCAYRAGISPQLWSDWRNNRAQTHRQGADWKPERETLDKIAKGLQVDISDVLEAAGYAVPAIPPLSVATFSDTSTDQLEEIRRMIDESQERFMERALDMFRQAISEQTKKSEK